MSLKSFHIFFITVAAILSIVMVIWGFKSYSTDGSGLGIGILGIAVIILLIPYARWFRKKAERIQLSLLLPLSVFVLPQAADACSVCFGDPNSYMVQGIKVGVWVMIGVVGTVLTLIASVTISWTKRARALDAGL